MCCVTVMWLTWQRYDAWQRMGPHVICGESLGHPSWLQSLQEVSFLLFSVRTYLSLPLDFSVVSGSVLPPSPSLKLLGPWGITVLFFLLYLQLCLLLNVHWAWLLLFIILFNNSVLRIVTSFLEQSVRFSGLPLIFITIIIKHFEMLQN